MLFLLRTRIFPFFAACTRPSSFILIFFFKLVIVIIIIVVVADLICGEASAIPLTPLFRSSIGGITGLTLAKSLSKHSSEPLDITLYDSAQVSSGGATVVGGGLQINGGASVLRTVLEDAEFRELRSNMQVMDGIVSNSNVVNQDKEDIGGLERLLSINVNETIRGFGASDLFRDGDGGGPTFDSYTVMRQTLMDSLAASVSRLDAVRMAEDKVLSVEAGNGETFSVVTETRTDHGYDLVVGCDGISSKVKGFVSDGKAIYSRIRVLYAVAEPSADESGGSTRLEQYFGEGGYGFTGTYGYKGNEKCKMAVVVYRDEGGEGDDEVSRTCYHHDIMIASSFCISSPPP